MSNFYSCPVQNCNRKYKTLAKLKDHLLVIHKQICDKDPEPIEITKDNKKAIEKKKNNDIEKINREKLREEILKKQQLEDELRKQEEEKFAENFRQLEMEKLRLKEEAMARQIEIEKIQGEFEKKCRDNIANSEECCICASAPRNTAVIPCGHCLFCWECIDEYHKKDPRNKCPCCRGDIMLVQKIFS